MLNIFPNLSFIFLSIFHLFSITITNTYNSLRVQLVFYLSVYEHIIYQTETYSATCTFQNAKSPYFRFKPSQVPGKNNLLF